MINFSLVILVQSGIRAGIITPNTPTGYRNNLNTMEQIRLAQGNSAINQFN